MIDFTKVISPRDGESRSDFISRCMSAEESAFPDRDQRLAVCSSKFEKRDDDLEKQQGRPPGKRRRMTKFRIDEVSSVDRPAQEGALAVLLKRRGEPGYDPDNPDPSKRGRLEPAELEKRGAVFVLTSVEDGHAHGVWLLPGDKGGTTSTGRIPGDEDHNHPWVMDDQGNITVAVNNGHEHSVSREQVMQTFMAMTVEELTSKRCELGQLLTKREFSSEERERLADRGAAMPDGSFPIVTKSDLSNAIQAFGRAQNKAAVARHIKRRAQAISATDLLPKEGRLADLLGKSAGAPGEEDVMDEKQIQELRKRAERAEKLAELSDAQKAHLKGLDGDEAKEQFLAKSDEDRQAEVDEALRKRSEDDPVVYKATDGTEFRKSDDPRLVKMAQDRDEDRRELAKARAASEQAGFEKRATEELAHYPGELSARVAIVKALSSIEDETEREAAFKAIAAGDSALRGAFTSRGARGVTEPSSAEEQLEKRAREYAEKHQVDFFTAYEKACEADPELAKRAIDGSN